MKLEYFISEKSPILMIALHGVLTKTTIPALEKCQAEIFAKPNGRHVIFSLKNLAKIELSGIPAFIVLQKLIRDDKRTVSLCYLKPAHRELLLSRGAIRTDEVFKELTDAFRALNLGNVT